VKFLFENESFPSRHCAPPGTPAQGADLCEVLVTVRGIPDGDEAAWHQRRKALAERLHAAYQGRSPDAREAWP